MHVREVGDQTRSEDSLLEAWGHVIGVPQMEVNLSELTEKLDELMEEEDPWIV